MTIARRNGGQRGMAAKDQMREKALDQPGQQEEGGVAGAGRRLPRRMPQWRTGNPNNSGIAGGVMERMEERWQEERKREKKK